MSYLFDSSSIVFCILTDPKLVHEYLTGNYTLDIALYEVSNAIIKQIKLRKLPWDKGSTLLKELIQFVSTYMNVLTLPFREFPEIINDIADIAIKYFLTFYDACYIYAAKQRKLILVSEDQDMHRVGKDLGIKVLSLKDLIK